MEQALMQRNQNAGQFIVKWLAAVGFESLVTYQEIENAMAKWKTKFKH
jgi:hypothetical protein